MPVQGWRAPAGPPQAAAPPQDGRAARGPHRRHATPALFPGPRGSFAHSRFLRSVRAPPLALTPGGLRKKGCPGASQPLRQTGAQLAASNSALSCPACSRDTGDPPPLRGSRGHPQPCTWPQGSQEVAGPAGHAGHGPACVCGCPATSSVACAQGTHDPRMSPDSHMGGDSSWDLWPRSPSPDLQP